MKKSFIILFSLLLLFGCAAPQTTGLNQQAVLDIPSEDYAEIIADDYEYEEESSTERTYTFDISAVSLGETTLMIDLPWIIGQDFAQFSRLENLRFLSISVPTDDYIAMKISNEFDDSANLISAISEIPNLERLSLNGFPIEDIAPLVNLSKLTWLNLNNVGDIDLSHLARMSQLEGLMLPSDVKDITPIENLNKLTTLSIGDSVQDLSPLRGLTNLEELTIATLHWGGGRVSDIYPLSGLTQLTSLTLSGNQIRDISPLRELNNLSTLYLNNNLIEDIAPLAGLANLERLQIMNNQIRDISPLARLRNLRVLEITGNPIDDLSQFERMPNLQINPFSGREPHLTPSLTQ